jgi:3-hydroxyisobutyrate dehydrogenase-like beta-hydroxyacid dehydrogenase
MLKIAVLGIGNAGGQVANVACAKGFSTFCINSSEKDLDIIN